MNAKSTGGLLGRCVNVLCCAGVMVTFRLPFLEDIIGLESTVPVRDTSLSTFILFAHNGFPHCTTSQRVCRNARLATGPRAHCQANEVYKNTTNDTKIGTDEVWRSERWWGHTCVNFALVYGYLYAYGVWSWFWDMIFARSNT